MSMHVLANRSWSGLLMALLLLCFLGPSTVVAQQAPPPSPISVPNPSTDLWRAVRQRNTEVAGTTQVKGVESGVLVSQSGEEFRDFRNEMFVGNAGLVIGAAAVVTALVYLLTGGIPIDGGRSGRRIKRFEDIDRVVHWFAAILFIVLALTGMTLLFGKYVILPLLGAEAFGVIASASKEAHNLMGPLFLVALVLLFVRFVSKNFPARGDLKWLLKGGGIVGNVHVSAGFFNAGEKVWFWMVMLVGGVVAVTGLILDFPIFGLGREAMQLSLIIHGIGAVLFFAGSFGHIYIGTIGSEGSIESMTTGHVDENWAKTHHDRWYEEVKGSRVEASPAQTVEPSRRGGGALNSPADKVP